MEFYDFHGLCNPWQKRLILAVISY